MTPAGGRETYAAPSRGKTRTADAMIRHVRHRARALFSWPPSVTMRIHFLRGAKSSSSDDFDRPYWGSAAFKRPRRWPAAGHGRPRNPVSRRNRVSRQMGRCFRIASRVFPLMSFMARKGHHGRAGAGCGRCRSRAEARAPNESNTSKAAGSSIG